MHNTLTSFEGDLHSCRHACEHVKEFFHSRLVPCMCMCMCMSIIIYGAFLQQIQIMPVLQWRECAVHVLDMYSNSFLCTLRPLFA